MYAICLLRYNFKQTKSKNHPGFGKITRFHKKKEYNAFSELSHICDCIVK